MPIRELFQCLAVTWCVQNRTLEDLAPGWSERMVGTTPEDLAPDWSARAFGTAPYSIGDDVEQSDWAALQADTTRFLV